MPHRTLTIGRVAAIPVRLHWSGLAGLGLLTATLRPLYAPSVCAGGAPCGADLALAALMAGLVGLSVLLHELGHALAARRARVPVRGITLRALGGEAEVEAESPSPEAEFAIAVAGPAVSLLIAAAAGLLWLARAPAAPPDPVAALAAHLAAANATLALFNLLPCYPMDGGRALQATLWFLGDDRLRATRAAAQAGRVCAWGLGLGGLALAMAARAPAAALWGGLAGLFLHRTSTASHRHLQLQIALRDVSVGDLMQRRLRAVGRDLTLEQFVARFVLGQAETAFPVAEPAAGERQRLLGMIALRNLRRFSAGQWAATAVGEAMTPADELAPLSPQAPALDALYALRDSPDGLLPVTEGEELVGLLRRRDIATFVQIRLARRR